MAKLVVRNWDQYQGYAKRGPAWIKLHVSLIEQPEYLALSTVARAVLPVLWIVASKYEGGEFPADDVAFLARVCHLDHGELSKALPELIAARFLIREESSQGARQDATESSPQTEGEGEGEQRETRASSLRDQARMVFAYWRRRSGHVKAVATEPRLRVIEARLREQATVSTGREPWRALVAAVEGAAFLEWKREGTGVTARAIDDFGSTFQNRGRDRIEKCLHLWREAGKPFPAEAQRALDEARAEVGMAVEEVAA